MTTEELLKKVRRIEIQTKRVSKHVFSGKYNSTFKGKGMSFSEVREYTVGDEIRTIDWNVTARFNSPHVKVFEEERELTFMLLLDFSSSIDFGSNQKTKKDLITELSAIIAYSAFSNNDQIGAIFTTEKVEKYIPPKKGKNHFLYILRELIAFKPKQTKTNLDVGLEFLSNVLKKRSTLILISDFISPRLNEKLWANSKHEIIAFKVDDPLEQKLPNLGVIELVNAETGEKTWVDTADVKHNIKLKEQHELVNYELKSFLNKLSIQFATFSTDEDYIPVLNQLFLRKK